MRVAMIATLAEQMTAAAGDVEAATAPLMFRSRPRRGTGGALHLSSRSSRRWSRLVPFHRPECRMTTVGMGPSRSNMS